jgi:hypothetical protein
VLLVAGVLAVLALWVASPARAASSPSTSGASLETLTPSSATLSGSVNPEGSEVTDCHFEYGRFTFMGRGEQHPSFEASVPCSALPGAGSSPVGVSAVATGLTNGDAYVFRIVATNSIGTTVGAYRDPFDAQVQEYLEVVRLSPSKGRTGGGKRVKLFGFDFREDTVTAVHFGTIGATRFEKPKVCPRICPIFAIAPPHAAGTVDVTVTTEDGQTSAVTPNDRFTYK